MKTEDSRIWGRTGVRLATWAVLALGAVGATAATELNLVPWPQTVVTQAGTFSLSAATKVVPGSPALQTLAAVLTNEFALAFGIPIAVDANASGSGNILLQLTNTLSNEAYHITVTTGGAVVEAGNYAALAAGSVSLLQAVSYAGTQATIPCLSITDAPFVSYRGLMIDCARKPQSVPTLQQLIELCRFYKLRYLQLHLADDQGFMFPSTNFPLLTTQNQSGPPFTRADLQGLESYSQARGVTIIPELEIPGHEGSMIRAMPDLFLITGTGSYVLSSTLNWAKPEVTNALDLLIGEMCSVFQATPYFHIGGDEADYSVAYLNTNFNQQFQALGYALPYDANDCYQLYRRLLRQLSQLIANKYGKQMLCWEGFYEDNSPSPLEPVPKTIPVMAFENAYYPANLLVQDGYPVINTAWNPLYVVNGTQCSPEHIYGWNMYQFGKYQPDWNQVVWITVPTNSPQVIGAQMCAWEQADSIELPSLRPRVPAMSERIWNPGAGRTYADFSNRVAVADVLLTAVTGGFQLAANAGSPKAVNPSAPAIAIGGSPTAQGGFAPYAYRWTPSTGLSSTTVANPTASPTATTTYTVTVTDNLGATGTGSVVVVHLAAATDYASYIGGTTPAGWWGMNETGAATTTADLSGTYGAANNGAGANLPLTYQNPGVNSLPGQAGIVDGATNRAAYFDGTSASGLFGNSPSAYASPTRTGTIYYYPSGFAIETWVKCDGLLATDCERLISTREFGLGFEANNGNSFGRIQFTTFAIKDYFSTNTMPADGQWHQIGISWDGTTGTTSFYTDGVSAGTMAGPTGLVGASSSSANSINLTHRTTDAQHFKGWVDEAVLWNHTRTALDFATSYAVASQPAPPPAFPASGFSRPNGVPTFDIPDTVATSTYTLLYKDRLTDSTWTALGSRGTGVGNGGTLRLSDPTVVGSLPAARYYRLQRNP